MRGHGLVLQREMARVQRDAPKRWKRPRQGRLRCVVHDYPMHTHPIVGEHGKVQDSTLQRARCEHACIVVKVVLV